MKSRIEKYKNIIIPLILKHLPRARIILYGSRAQGTWREGSDIDVALDIGTKIDDRTMTFIINDIEESVLPINFDIVDFHNISEEMRQEIKKTGVVWHE